MSYNFFSVSDTGQEDTRKARDGLRTMEERLHDLREEVDYHLLQENPSSYFKHNIPLNCYLL